MRERGEFLEVTVFGDLLFFVNFCMDFQCLFLTARLLRRPFPVLRAALASALGAAYAVVALFMQTAGPMAFLADCGVCLLMCLLTYCAKEIKIWRILTPFGVYFVVSFAVGGAMSGMASLLSHIRLPIPSGGGDVSSGLFFLLATAGGLATFWWGRVCQRRARNRHAILRVTLLGKELVAEAMVDTANLLRDPVSDRPVVLLSAGAAERILPDVLSLADPCGVALLPGDIARRVRILPAGSATGKRLLLAVVPDAAYLDAGHGETPVDILLAAVEATTFDGTDVLLPASLLTE